VKRKLETPLPEVIQALGWRLIKSQRELVLDEVAWEVEVRRHPKLLQDFDPWVATGTQG
jgi:hypothetical protein